MLKLRNGGSDIEQLAQWLARKCRNHNPLEELAIPTRLDIAKQRAGVIPATRAGKPNMYKPKKNGKLALLAEKRNTMVYEAEGRVFVIEVRELEGDEFAEVLAAPKVEIGR